MFVLPRVEWFDWLLCLRPRTDGGSIGTGTGDAIPDHVRPAALFEGSFPQGSWPAHNFMQRRAKLRQAPSYR